MEMVELQLACRQRYRKEVVVRGGCRQILRSVRWKKDGPIARAISIADLPAGDKIFSRMPHMTAGRRLIPY